MRNKKPKKNESSNEARVRGDNSTEARRQRTMARKGRQEEHKTGRVEGAPCLYSTAVWESQSESSVCSARIAAVSRRIGIGGPAFECVLAPFPFLLRALVAESAAPGGL